MTERIAYKETIEELERSRNQMLKNLTGFKLYSGEENEYLNETYLKKRVNESYDKKIKALMDNKEWLCI